MNNQTKKELKGLAKSFQCAVKGVVFCIKTERNMRIHVSAAIFVLLLGFTANISSQQAILLGAAVTLVLFAEMINTAIESIVARLASNYDRLAKIAKDIAAGAVLLCALFSLAVGAVIFLQPQQIKNLLVAFACYPVLYAVFAVLLVIAVIFIFIPPANMKRKVTIKNRK